MLLGIKSFSQEKDLFYFLAKAQKNSPLLIDYKNQIQSATLDSLLYRATNKTQITGNLNANYSPIIKGFGYDTALSNGQSISGLLNVSKKIIGKNQNQYQSQTFALLKQTLDVNRKIALKDLNKAIISQYIAASGSAQQVDYNKKIAFLLNQEIVILKKLTQNGIYKQTDYLMFSATVKQQELTVLQLQQQNQNDLALLNYLSGETDTTFINLKKPIIELKRLKNETKIIFLKQFEVDSLKLINQNKLIDIAYKPSLTLLSDAGYLSTFTNQGYKNFGFSVGLGVSIPIYDGNQRLLQHQKNEAALLTNLAYKTNLKKQYSQQLLMLNLKLTQANTYEKQLQSQLIIYEALIEANKKLLYSGDAQITDYIITLGNLISIKNTISLNSINKLQTINEINYWSFND